MADVPAPAVQRLPDADAVAAAVAAVLADRLGRAVVERGIGVVALSGGSTPLPMFRRLATAELDWRRIHVVQVDERVAPDGHPDRNWTAIDRELVDRTGAVGHPMPADEAVDAAAAADYAALLDDLCGGMPDVIHLGLGADGHTASLVPGDPVLDLVDVDVAVTAPYQGRRRVTLTAPAIDRARTIVWEVVGEEKRTALAGLLRSDPALPATLVRRAGDVRVIADVGAAGPGSGGTAGQAGGRG